MTDPHKSLAQIAFSLDNPMYVVTTTDGRSRAGCLVGFATQCSVHPPRWLVCLSKKNQTWTIAQRAHVVALHFLQDDDVELAELFGGETADEVDKFARCAWWEGPGGVPILTRCETWLAGSILQRMDTGDHEALLLEPLHAEAGTGHRQLGFQRVKHIEPGHEP